MKQPFLTLHFSGDLPLLLRNTRSRTIKYPLNRRSSIKDIIESLGIPHTEIGAIKLKNWNLSFNHIPSAGESITIIPFTQEIINTIPTKLWSEKWSFRQFMIDATVRKLGRTLRMAGIDTQNSTTLKLTDVGELCREQKRVVLTRNRELLRCSSVIYGQLLRSELYEKQFLEVVTRYNLFAHLEPFSRCMSCNGKLDQTDKKEILHRLEPLTKKFFHHFKMCHCCKKIYWKGSHHESMLSLLDRLQHKDHTRLEPQPNVIDCSEK